MDRFIVAELIFRLQQIVTFKIQYGQIYSTVTVILSDSIADLKSNMDRFIGNKRIQPVCFDYI